MLRYAIIFIGLLVSGCGSGVLDVESSRFSTAQKRVDVLTKYVVMASGVDDTIFHLFNVNGKFSLSIPGASSWDYKIVMKVNQNDLMKWTDGFVEITQPDEDLLDWGYALIQEQPGWSVHSTPTVYTREHTNAQNETIVAIFHTEGIIFKRILQR
jgi:hypothetical protein